MEYIVTKTIPRKELTEYKDYIGFIFKNENGVFNICHNEEDVIKSNQWFKNFPLNTLIVSDEEIKVGDMFLAVCNNEDLNGKTFRYKGNGIETMGLIIIEREGKETLTTINILTDSYKFVRIPTREDKEKLVNGKITPKSI